MHNARSRNCTERHTRTRRTRIAAGEHLSGALQPELVPAGLRSSLLKPGGDDQGNHPETAARIREAATAYTVSARQADYADADGHKKVGDHRKGVEDLEHARREEEAEE